MQDLPIDYFVSAEAQPEGTVPLKVEEVPRLITAAPAKPGEHCTQWTPELLLVAAVVDGFVFSFRAIARASQITWLDLCCQASGTLGNDDKVIRFTALQINATLTVPAGTDVEKANRMLEKALATCQVANSLIAKTTPSIEIVEK